MRDIRLSPANTPSATPDLGTTGALPASPSEVPEELITRILALLNTNPDWRCFAEGAWLGADVVARLIKDSTDLGRELLSDLVSVIATAEGLIMPPHFCDEPPESNS